MGQLIYQSKSGNNGSIVEGIEHPYEIYVIQEPDGINDIYLECKAYPNPTSDFLILKLNSSNILHLSFCLYDAEGKLIQKNNIESNETKIQMKNLNPSIYYLKVYSEKISLQNDKKNVKTFKIIKK